MATESRRVADDALSRGGAEEEEAEAAKRSKQARKRAKKKAAAKASDADATTSATQQEAQPLDAQHGSRSSAASGQREDCVEPDGSSSPQPAADQPKAVARAAEQGGDTDDSWACCTSSKVRMRDPVIASHGFCYEKQAIAAWVQERGAVSPVTGKSD